MSKNKSIRKWFEEFEEPYRTEAIDNGIAERGEEHINTYEHDTAHGALMGCFHWSESPQGWPYWAELHDKLEGTPGRLSSLTTDDTKETD